MKISQNAVAVIDYTLTDDDGNTLDKSSDGNFAYLHNGTNIIPGLENALVDKEAGEKLQVTIAPAEAYGERELERIQSVPREMFPAEAEIQIGMQFQGQSPDGHVNVVTVTEVKDAEVIVDGNHPLAGKTLHFDVEVISVREATEEELSHGHVHGPGGHDH